MYPSRHDVKTFPELYEKLIKVCDQNNGNGCGIQEPCDRAKAFDERRDRTAVPIQRPMTKKDSFGSMSMFMTNTMTVTFALGIRY